MRYWQLKIQVRAAIELVDSGELISAVAAVGTQNKCAVDSGSSGSEDVETGQGAVADNTNSDTDDDDCIMVS